MKKKTQKKLVLHRETLRIVADASLHDAAGGSEVTSISCWYLSACCANTLEDGCPTRLECI